jgi:hypothetical protein
MIRREYSSKCVIDPWGTVARIGDNMPETDGRLIQTSYTKYRQGVYTHQAQKFRAHMSLKNPNASKSHSDLDYILNSRTVRILNFGLTSLLLFFVNFIYNAKVLLSSGTSPVENPHIVKLRDECNKGTEAGDKELPSRLMVDIRENLLNEVESLTQDYDPNFRLPFLSSWLQGDLDDISVLDFVAFFVQTSPRIGCLLSALVDQVAARNEKAMMFTANPFEQQLTTIILQRSGLLANALLATMPTLDKEELIKRFNTPLLRVLHPGRDQSNGADMEVIVLSYFMNSGLNLHPQCGNLHCLTPPPSFPTYIQTVGRIARYGQKWRCLVISYVVDGTFNIRLFSTLTLNALPAVAAVILEQNEDMELKFDGWLVVDGELMGPADARFPPKEDRKKPNVRAPDNDISLYMFNAALGESHEMTKDGSTVSLSRNEPLWKNIQEVPPMQPA